MEKMELEFYKGKKVLLTGHSGFKGTWMSNALVDAGAELVGYSLCREKEIDFFKLTGVGKNMKSIKGDIRDLEKLKRVFEEEKPEIVIHMAAQPIVRESYYDPVGTYSTNVMGTVNVFEATRTCDSVQSILNVTTDKVYLNDERNKGFKEDEPLDGYDPYSNSKSCSELVSHSYYNSFLRKRGVKVSSARAGNVIGGGDFSKDRIIPDCVRAAVNGEEIIVRNPYSTRPYQHVLEPIMAYLLIAKGEHPGWYNVGPNDNDCFQTGKLVDVFVRCWGDGLKWIEKTDGGPHEAGFLKLDSTKMKSTFGWEPKWDLNYAVSKTVEWYKIWNNGDDIKACMKRQIKEYIE